MRLFLATTFPSEILRELNAAIAPLRPRLPAASWVREEAQHLTLAFLGEQEESLVDVLAEALSVTIAAIPRFEARVRGAGFFPNPRRARVGWAGLEPEAPFVALAGSVRDVLATSGVRLDGADFKPHLTLMRIRDPWPPSSIDRFNRTLRDYTSATFSVERVTLYASRLDPKGAIHTPMRTFALR